MPDHPAKAPPLSPRMRKVLDPARTVFRHPKASAKEVNAIRAILSGRDRAKADVALGRAIRVAVDADPSEATAAAVAKVLADSKVDAAVRLQAAALLGLVPARASVRALLAMLGREDSAMDYAVLDALAKIGDARAAQAIAALRTDSPALARIRDFVRTAILYRSGGEVERKAERSVMPRGTPLPIRREPPEAVAETIEALRGSSYGASLRRTLGFSFSCQGNRHLVLLDEGIAPGRFLRDLRARPRIAGIVAMHDRAVGRFITRRIILTRPDGDGVAVSIVRPSGEVALLGSLRPGAKGMALTLSDHGGERVPMWIEGIVTDDDIVLRGRLFAESAPPKRRGKPIVRR